MGRRGRLGRAAALNLKKGKAEQSAVTVQSDQEVKESNHYSLTALQFLDEGTKNEQVLYASLNMPGEDGSYDGSYMIPAEAYDYSQDVIPGKMREDFLYYLHGGPWYLAGMRATELFWRDLTAESNEETVKATVAMVFIKGYGKVAAELYHRVTKPEILNAVGKSNYIRRVGNNPDVEIINNQIRLNGNGPYKNKSYDTGINSNSFFK